MAIFEKTIRNKNFDKLLRKLEQEIPDSSWSADLEAGSDFKEGDAYLPNASPVPAKIAGFSSGKMTFQKIVVFFAPSTPAASL